MQNNSQIMIDNNIKTILKGMLSLNPKLRLQPK